MSTGRFSVWNFDTGVPLLVAALENAFVLPDFLSSAELANLRVARRSFVSWTGPAWRERVAVVPAPKQ
jgi:hypothetical protein